MTVETETGTPAEEEEAEGRMSGGRKVTLSSRSCLAEEEEEQLHPLIPDLADNSSRCTTILQHQDILEDTLLSLPLEQECHLLVILDTINSLLVITKDIHLLPNQQEIKV